MFKIFSRSQPIIPIVYVDAHVNQINASILLNKLRKTKYHSAQAIGVVCSVTNNMPVQVDKLYQQIHRIRQQYKIPVYSFLTDHCNPQSYFMASCADYIYTLPSTIFNLQHTSNKLIWDDFLSQYHLKKYVIKSGDALNGNTLDQFTSPNTADIINKKDNGIDNKLYTQALNSRLERVKKQEDNKIYDEIKTKLPKNIPDLMIGQQAIKAGLVDQVGEHYQILKDKYPECRFQVIKQVNEPKMKWSILIALFVIKGTIKWSLIMYFWLKSKENKKNNANNNNNINENNNTNGNTNGSIKSN